MMKIFKPGDKVRILNNHTDDGWTLTKEALKKTYTISTSNYPFIRFTENVEILERDQYKTRKSFKHFRLKLINRNECYLPKWF